MASTQARPKRWSRGIFRSKAATKISVLEDPVESSSHDACRHLIEPSNNGSNSPDSDRKVGPNRLQRGSSKILSALGIRNSSESSLQPETRASNALQMAGTVTPHRALSTNETLPLPLPLPRMHPQYCPPLLARSGLHLQADSRH